MRHYSAESLPRLWWLSPWSTCREMHGMLRAFQALAEQDSKLHSFHLRKIYELCDSIKEAGEATEALRRRIAELEAAVITGDAIVPDAKPEEEPSK